MPTSTTSVPASLQTFALSKSYRCGTLDVPVLSRLALSILPGELTLVTGPSGCGKSTLLSLLGGLQQPDAGHVMALGKDLGKLSARELEQFRLLHTGFVFQSFNLFSALTAREQVELPLRYLALSPTQVRAAAQAALEEVGLGHRADFRPAQLSGGEKQRVALARAVAKKPQLLFADEPTGALDAHSGQNVINLLHGIARKRGSTVLCVSHDPRLIRHADRVLAMEDGHIDKEWRDGGLGWPP